MRFKKKFNFSEIILLLLCIGIFGVLDSSIVCISEVEVYDLEVVEQPLIEMILLYDLATYQTCKKIVLVSLLAYLGFRLADSSFDEQRELAAQRKRKRQEVALKKLEEAKIAEAKRLAERMEQSRRKLESLERIFRFNSQLADIISKTRK
jgi:hypothetical protein